MFLNVKCNWKIKTLIKKSLYSLISGPKPQSCPWCRTGSRCSRLPAICLPCCLLTPRRDTVPEGGAGERLRLPMCDVSPLGQPSGGTAPPSGEPSAAQGCLGLKGGRLATPGRCSHLKAAGPGVAACWACGGWGWGWGVDRQTRLVPLEVGSEQTNTPITIVMSPGEECVGAEEPTGGWKVVLGSRARPHVPLPGMPLSPPLS